MPHPGDGLLLADARADGATALHLPVGVPSEADLLERRNHCVRHVAVERLLPRRDLPLPARRAWCRLGRNLKSEGVLVSEADVNLKRRRLKTGLVEGASAPRTKGASFHKTLPPPRGDPVEDLLDEFGPEVRIDELTSVALWAPQIREILEDRAYVTLDPFYSWRSHRGVGLSALPAHAAGQGG